MSSAEDDYGSKSGAGEDHKTKKRRIQRACDNCRRKKIRCDGATTEGRCSNCAAYNHECTYVEAAKKRGPPKGYVESLESRLQKMESLLQRLCPDADFTQELGLYMDRETWYAERGKRGTSAASASPAPASTTARKSRPSSPGATAPSSIYGTNTVSDEFGASDDDPALIVPSEELKRLTVTSLDRRFHGKSSGLVLVQTAIDMKREYTGGDLSNPEPMPKQQEFWNNPDWEGKRGRAPDDIVDFDFPPPDLMGTLVDLYFRRNNVYLPLLHRPTFERQYHESLHEVNRGFASILLLVCAIGSRYTNDERVLRASTEDGEDGPSKHSAGWKYFDQLQLQRKSLISPATLFDLQQYALAGIFLQGSATPYASWVMVGIGLRVAQDVGAHRKRASVAGEPFTVDDELWKRAFWVLVNLDRLGSAALGRPCAIHDEDFDLDPPLEVDDEYWEAANPEDAFKQPVNVPSTVAYFIASIKLDQILSFALRTIYSINKSKILLGFVGDQWEQHTVAELDSALNQWLDSVPDHLRWNPTQDFSVFFQQSAILYATYYHIQILVHRPFIPGPRKPSPLSFPSLAICTNAARSCSHVLDTQRRKCDAGPAPNLMFYAFTSGLVLLLNIWGIRKPGGLTSTPQTAMKDVHMCMSFLNAAEKRWHLAGKLGEILRELASAGEFPLPQGSPEFSNKRERDSDSPKSAPPSEYMAPSDAAAHPRPIARPGSLMGARRATGQLPVPSNDFAQMTSLPMNSTDLGRYPLHPDFMQPPQVAASGPGQDAMAGMQWLPQQGLQSTDASHASSTFVPTASTQQPVLPMFGTAPDGGQIYPASAPSYAGGFAQQQEHDLYPQPQPMTGTEQNPPWGDTISMWSTAPQGFEWNDWDTFTASMQEQNPPS